MHVLFGMLVSKVPPGGCLSCAGNNDPGCLLLGLPPCACTLASCPQTINNFMSPWTGGNGAATGVLIADMTVL